VVSLTKKHCGYMGNPALHPFIYRCATRDILIVQINPINSPGTPRRARDIFDRVNEITFNSSLMAEFRVVQFDTLQLRRREPESWAV